LEEIAQLDPYGWKTENLAKPGGRKGGPDSALAVLEAATELSDFIRKYSAYSAVKKRRRSIDQGTYPLRGIGLSLICQRQDGQSARLQRFDPARKSFAMRLVFDRTRRLRIYTSLVDGAMGIHRILTEAAAQLLDLDPHKVAVQPVDTRDVPDTGPSLLSEAAVVALTLLEQCCAGIRRKRKGGTLPIEVRRSLTVATRGSGTSGRAGRDRRRAEQLQSESSWAATVIEVELDPVTFQSTCRGVWMAIEMGTVWDQNRIQGVLEGEILRCLGSSRLSGHASADEAQRSACLVSDLIPAATGLPEIQLEFLENRNGVLKGFDHLPHLGVPAAYAAAVCQATGLYIDQIPITGEVIQQCLET
jgi:CO/xanthine dehydrogenase Mo-binding subunit